ncbi:uncharacterized protein LOC106085051 isoform X2 [Stomoxys calcitrans]|nr:uncharacterized protein LOC106085051 isoform X2 [Stomoxys calcitrans]
MGVNTHQDDYYESLFRRTTASFRAKHNKENIKTRERVPTNENHSTAKTRKQSRQGPQRPLHESNRSNDHTARSETNTESRGSKAASKQEYGFPPAANTTTIKSMVEDMVAKILEEKLSNSTGTPETIASMGSRPMATVVQDLVNKILKDKLYGQNESSPGSSKPLNSVIEDIVNEKLKEKLATLQAMPGTAENQVNWPNLHKDLTQNLKISKDKTDASKTLNSQAILTELLAKDDKPTSSNKQRSTTGRSQTPEWERLTENNAIKRMPRPRSNLPEWRGIDNESKDRPSTSQRTKRSQSPGASSSCRTSSRSLAPKGTSVLIPRSGSRPRKPTNSDPVALYQYYKNEWDYFRRYIPGETNHNRLRWHVRQRFLDPE